MLHLKITGKEIFSMTIAPKVFGQEYLLLLADKHIYMFLVKYFYLKYVGLWGGFKDQNLSVQPVTKIRFSGENLFLKLPHGLRALHFVKKRGKVALETRHFSFDHHFATDFNDLCVFESTVLGKRENVWVSFPKIIRFGVGVMYVKVELLADTLDVEYKVNNDGLNYNKDGSLCFNYSRSRAGDIHGIFTANSSGVIRHYVIEYFKSMIIFKKVEQWTFRAHSFTAVCEISGSHALVAGTKLGRVLFIDLRENKILREESIGEGEVVHSIIEDFRPHGRAGFWAVGRTTDSLKYFQLTSFECDLMYIREDTFFNRFTRQRMEATEQEIFNNIDSFSKKLAKRQKKLDKLKGKARWADQGSAPAAEPPAGRARKEEGGARGHHQEKDGPASCREALAPEGGEEELQEAEQGNGQAVPTGRGAPGEAQGLLQGVLPHEARGGPQGHEQKAS